MKGFLWRLLHDDGRLRFHDALRLQGITLSPTKNEAVVRTRAIAARRCVGCWQHERCDRLLAARDWDGLRDICPNSGFFALTAP